MRHASEVTAAAVQARKRSSRRRGFTLLEMLAVIIIISILASILLGALQAADQKSKGAATKSLIGKMHNMLMARWDAYRTVRLPIAAVTSTDGPQYDAKNESQRFRQNIARRRMLALRELMRMEMPDRYADLFFTPTVLVQPVSEAPIRPYLWNAYRRKLQLSQNANPATRNLSQPAFLSFISKQYESAECLYLIMTTGIDDSSVATEHFAAGNFGDRDHDGMMEIHDAWGNPIEFLRWAPGFDSPVQPLFRYASNDARYNLFHSSQPTDPDDPSFRVSHWQIKIDTVTGANNAATTRVVVIDQDDPLNPMRVGPLADTVSGQRGKSTRWLPGMECPEYGFMLTPLIYSRGPDFESGLLHCYAGENYTQVPHPFYGQLSESDPYNKYQGSAGTKFRGDTMNKGYEHDNIHNHQLVLR